MYSPFQSLQFESCQISLACCRLLKLIHEVLKQATGGSSGPGLAVMLYRTSRDCLEIFEGVVQVCVVGAGSRDVQFDDQCSFGRNFGML